MKQKQKQRQKQKQKQAPHLLIYEAYQDLNQAIDEMDMKVQAVIRKHEAQFLFAYRNHIQKIKLQLLQIKNKSQQQQKKLQSNDRAIFFEKQMALFREQALNLYDKFNQKNQENELYRNQISMLQQSLRKIQKDNKYLLRQLKDMKVINEHQKEKNSTIAIKLEQKIIQLQKKQSEKNKDVFLIKTKNQTENIDDIMQKTEIPKYKIIPSKVVSPSQDIFNNFKRKTMQGIKQRNRSFNVPHLSVEDSQLKQWFLSCVLTIKRQVAQRSNYSSQNFDLEGISSIEEFKMVDKLRLLQIFLQNQKLMVWMYEKIFPNRMCEIKAYLKGSDKNIKNIEQVNKTVQQLQELIIENDPSTLPMVQKKQKSLPHRKIINNKISIKAGKLNISNL